MFFTTAFVALISATASVALPAGGDASGVTKGASTSAANTKTPKNVLKFPNWYGVVANRPISGGPFTSVSATLEIPKLTVGQGTADAYGISAFIGLDGGHDDHTSVAQVGVDLVITPDGAGQTTSDGSTLILRLEQEWYPEASTEVTEEDFKISFGDTLKLSVTTPPDTTTAGTTHSKRADAAGTNAAGTNTPGTNTPGTTTTTDTDLGTTVNVNVENTSTGQTFNKQLTAPEGVTLGGSTAEWIVVSILKPDGEVTPPPDFGTLTFTEAVATAQDGTKYGPDSGVVIDEGTQFKSQSTKDSVAISYDPNVSGGKGVSAGTTGDSGGKQTHN